MAVGLALMTQLRADTSLPVLWFWMFLTGLGIGPTLAVFTIIVQNAVPFEMLGVATANLTFFRQIGGSVALAIAGTIFGTTLQGAALPADRCGGVPQPVVDGFKLASGRRRARLQQARRRRGGRGPGDPQPGPGAVPGHRQAAHPEHRRRDPPGVQPGRRPDVLHRRRGGCRRGPRRGVDARAPAPQRRFAPHKAHGPEPVGGASIQSVADDVADAVRVRVDAAD